MWVCADVLETHNQQTSGKDGKASKPRRAAAVHLLLLLLVAGSTLEAIQSLTALLALCRVLRDATVHT
jgi:hypothetical protein